jgi:hypothetical protein
MNSFIMILFDYDISKRNQFMHYQESFKIFYDSDIIHS